MLSLQDSDGCTVWRIGWQVLFWRQKLECVSLAGKKQSMVWCDEIGHHGLQSECDRVVFACACMREHIREHYPVAL